MKKITKRICFILAAGLILSNGSFAYTVKAHTPNQHGQTEETADDEKEKVKEKSEWSVFIYLCGTDLESNGGMASQNLEMISKTVPNSNVNVVFQTGGTKEWKAREKVGIDISTEKIQRWSYDEEGFTLVDEQDNSNMANHRTLSEFIQWGTKTYPAEKNLLIVWDHGCGSARGLLMDELHDQALMSVEGLERALKDGGEHFDLFMTDTCLMANLETSQAISGYADYFVASEEVVPGLGSNYEEWLQDLYDEPECGPERLGKNICDATQVMYAEAGDDSFLKGLTFSVIDLSKIDAVAEAYEEYMKEATALVADPVAFGDYLMAVSKTDRFEEIEMWDLYDLARRSMNTGISKETVHKLQNAVDAAVVTSIRGAYHPYAHGLSVFMSYNAEVAKLDRLARTSRNPWQMAFLDAVNLKWEAPEWSAEVTGEVPQLNPELYTVKFDTEADEEQNRQLLNIRSGIGKGDYVRYELQRYDEKNDAWFSLGESEDVDLIKNDDNGLVFVADFSGKWPAIDDDYLYVTSKGVEANTVLMQGTILIPDINPRVMNLRIFAEHSEGLEFGSEVAEEEGDHVIDYTVTGVWDGYNSSTGLPDRNTYSLSDLEGIEFSVCKAMYSDYFKKIGDWKTYDPKEFTLNLEVVDKELPAGQYRLRYTISDMLSRTYETDFVNFTWDGNNAVFDLEKPEEETEEASEEAKILTGRMSRSFK